MTTTPFLAAAALIFAAGLACNKEGQATPATTAASAQNAPATPGAPAAPALPTAEPTAPEPQAAPGEKQYRVEAAELRVKAGATGVGRVVIKPIAGLHFNPEYPAKFAVTAAAFAKCTKDKLTLKGGDVKIEGNDGILSVPLQAVAAGAGAIEIVGSFSVCSNEQCYMLRDEKLTLQVAVQ